jgi:hypothetical protein
MSTINVNAIDKESGSTLTLGGAGTTVAVHASATTSGFDSGLASMQVFTSSGTWTKPSGITKVIVEVQGGGGSGSTDTVGSDITGGGGGGYAKKLIDVSSISSATITVGTGGAAVSGAGTSGNDGGNSVWSDGTNTITANGGSLGSAAAPSKGGQGGTATGGNVNIQGQGGGWWHSCNGKGGDSVLGSGGVPSSDTSNRSGYGYGSGGSTGYDQQNNAAETSGAGANGIVIVTEYK